MLFARFKDETVESVIFYFAEMQKLVGASAFHA